jgi:hypothetical protein
MTYCDDLELETVSKSMLEVGTFVVWLVRGICQARIKIKCDQ